MADPINITVNTGNPGGETAPAAEDLLCQIQDFLGVLRGVERTISDDGTEEIVWRITDAGKNSPLAIELTPTPPPHVDEIDIIAARVVQKTAKGLKQIANGEKPTIFDKKTLGRAEKIYGRLAPEGLYGMIVDFGKYEDAPEFNASFENAPAALENLAASKDNAQMGHRELGSLEGFVSKVGLDGRHRPILWVKSRLDGQEIKCMTDGKGLDRIGHLEIHEVFEGLRVRVHGMLHFKEVESIGHIQVEGVDVFQEDKDLPSLEDVISPNFTGGLESSEYLKVIHSDD